MMGKYNEYITRNGLDYTLDSTYEYQFRAKRAAKRLKKKRSVWTGKLEKTGISTRIIQHKNGRYLLYKRQN